MKKGLLEQRIGERFRIVREAYQLSQRLFAERIGKTQGYVSQVENGYVAPDVEIIRTVCDMFGISAGWMLSGEGEMEGSTVGERVRMIRRKHAYTQEELAEQAGCSRVAISLIENGKEKPTERLLRRIAEKTFGDLIPLILTDNGNEFNNISAFENALDGRKESMLFFAKPYCSSDKPRVEKNHTLVRDILPKGTSFDNLTQQDVNLVMSHVNGVVRKGLHGKSAYDVFCSLFSEKLAATLGVSRILPVDVIQSPDLLKNKIRSAGT